MTIAKHSDKELQEFLRYELSPDHLVLFDGHGMRKETKSSLYKAFTPTEQTEFNDTKYVIDGDFLLHRVKWRQGQTYADICSSYVSYVKSNYKLSAIVVFDGYPDEACGSTKRLERLRRAQRKQSAAISLTEIMVPIVSQDSFLANPKIKSRFISMLMEKLHDAKIYLKQAVEDADILIILTPLEMAPSNEHVTVLGEDIDLLPGKGKVSQSLYNAHLTAEKILLNHILFLHAMSDCNTTSALFNQGKLKFLKVLQKNKDLQLVQQWLSGQATPNEQQKDPSEWGWQKTSSGLVPIPTTLDPAPNSILRYISCKCKKGCQRNCGCRKAGLHYSPICASCEGLCNNVEPPEDSSDIDVEETEERGRGERLPTQTMEQSDPEPGPDAIEEPHYDPEEQAEPGLIVIEEP
ncbi:unnamed protein product [Diabrotica balteata]|uniref:Tesmin/TSO1-like CXC domain-containing protein n=1 Tax=Diabrotica balteata TaxID=107213 RepID=A0A9N9T426_DIABA|nr:unnamed protein product [Diabrotica balteata]